MGTGCPLYFTPPKYWPEDIAKRFLGKKEVFGILRDPVERFVAQFRGNSPNYGGGAEAYFKTCDVDGGVKYMVQQHISGKDPYGTGCTRIEQAEYFEGDCGIKVPVDNRRFPYSVNELFHSRGYTTDDWNIKTKDIFHVNGCNHIGAWNITSET